MTHESNRVASKDSEDRMQRAWRWRRESFDWPLAAGLARLQAADQLLASVAEDARRSGDLRNLAQALHLRANMAADRAWLDEAETLWRESVRLCEQVGDDLMLAHKVRHLGDVMHRRGQLDDTLRHYARAEALYRAHPPAAGGAQVDLANLLIRLAAVREEQGQTGPALEAWREAKALYVAAGLDVGVEDCESHIARLTKAE